MNDITALSQRMKAEDISPERMEWLKKLADMEYCASNPGHWLMNLKETNYLAALALQCLESNLALVEALESRDKQIAELELREAFLDARHVKLTTTELNLSAARQRITELESRTVTVKLPAAWWVKQGPQELLAYEKQMLLDALAAAGIQVMEVRA